MVSLHWTFVGKNALFDPNDLIFGLKEVFQVEKTQEKCVLDQNEASRREKVQKINFFGLDCRIIGVKVQKQNKLGKTGGKGICLVQLSN